MRSGPLLLLAAGLLLWALLSPPARPTPAAANPVLPTHHRHPQGLFSLGDGRTLLLQEGRFVVSAVTGTKSTSEEGTVHLDARGRLVFRNARLDTTCDVNVVAGHLLMEVMGPEACRLWMLPGDRGAHTFDGMTPSPELLPRGSVAVDLGPVKLLPLRECDGLARWVSEASAAAPVVRPEARLHETFVFSRERLAGVECPPRYEVSRRQEDVVSAGTL